jgi:uncharacterized membrane protein YeaQ/YmgE (transglycosylase-associated protein family)
MGIKAFLYSSSSVRSLAGWADRQGFRLWVLGNIVVGIVGSFIAGPIFPRVGLAFGGGILAAIVHATLGAVILLGHDKNCS